MAVGGPAAPQSPEMAPVTPPQTTKATSPIGALFEGARSRSRPTLTKTRVATETKMTRSSTTVTKRALT